MVRTKIEKPVDEIPYIDEKTGRLTRIEYELSSYFEYDKELKKEMIVFELATYKMFTNFKYNITYNLIKNQRQFNIHILGLSAPDISFPFTGKANAKIKFENLSGIYTINIIKQDGTTNSFKVDINSVEKKIKFKKEIILDKKKDKRFVLYLEKIQ